MTVRASAPTTDAELARIIAVEVGLLVVSLRPTYGDLSDPSRSRRLRDDGDRAAHDLIVARLAEHRPHDAVLSEEGLDDDTRLSHERVWIVDPIDGTWEYGQGREDFAVHVALWEAGVLVAGAVDLPARGLVHTTDRPSMVADALPRDRPVRIVVSRSRPPADLDSLVTGVATRLGREIEVVSVGSAGAKTAEVIEGRVEAYVHDAGLSEWDVAAPAAVASACGLRVCHLDGSEIRYNKRPPLVGDLVIGVPMVLEAILEVRAGLSTSG